MRELISELLNENVTVDEFMYMRDDWKEFCSNPSKYANTVVIDMVKQWLVQLRQDLYDMQYVRSHCGAQYVMLEDLI